MKGGGDEMKKYLGIILLCSFFIFMLSVYLFSSSYTRSFYDLSKAVEGRIDISSLTRVSVPTFLYVY